MADNPEPWQALLSQWGVIAGIAGVWARLEVALALGRAKQNTNAAQIDELKQDARESERVIQGMAVQMGKVEQGISHITATLDRMAKKLDG